MKTAYVDQNEKKSQNANSGKITVGEIYVKRPKQVCEVVIYACE